MSSSAPAEVPSKPRQAHEFMSADFRLLIGHEDTSLDDSVIWKITETVLNRMRTRSVMLLSAIKNWLLLAEINSDGLKLTRQCFTVKMDM